MFHRHKWIKIEKTFAPPLDTGRGKTFSENSMEKILLGVTTILWECSICKKIRKEEMLGKELQACAEKKKEGE